MSEKRFMLCLFFGKRCKIKDNVEKRFSVILFSENNRKSRIMSKKSFFAMIFFGKQRKIKVNTEKCFCYAFFGK